MSHDPFEARDGTCVNPSAEPAIATIIDVRLSRRTVLKGMAASGAFGLFGCGTIGSGSETGADGSAPLDFTEVGRTTDDKHHVAPGYNAQVLIAPGRSDPSRRAAVPPRAADRRRAGATVRYRQRFHRLYAAAARLELVDTRAARREPREPPRRALLSRSEEPVRSDARAVRSPDGGAGLYRHRDREGGQPLAAGRRQSLQPPHLD